MSPETELVLTLCRTPLGEPARHRVASLIEGSPEWDVVFALAAAWEVEPVAFSNLREFAAGRLELSIIERAALREREARGFALARALVLVNLERQFRAQTIQVLVLKGPSVGVIAYGDASMRTFGDIDFLVKRQDLTKARDLLLSLGYERDYSRDLEWNLIRGEHALEFSGHGQKVELHFALVERHLRFGLDVNDVWRDSEPMVCAGSEVRVMSRPQMMLFLCAHATKHEWARLRWICDVAQLCARLTQEEVIETAALARRLNAKRILALGLRLAHDVLGEDIERFSPGELAPEGATTPAMQAVQHTLGLGSQVEGGQFGWLNRLGPGVRPLLFWLNARERMTDRIASLAWVAFVPTDRDTHSGIGGWLSRPARLAGRIVRKSVTAR